MKTELSDAQLAEMATTLRGWAEHFAHTNAFRTTCGQAADLIGRYLDGETTVEAETAAAVESVFNVAGPAEIERMKAFSELDDRMGEAAIADDPNAWREAMTKALPLMSENMVLNLMEAVHWNDGDDIVEVGVPITSWVHAMPDLAQ